MNALVIIWRVLRQRDGIDSLEISDESGLVLIARVFGDKRAERAALIAAAPDLLAAAQKLEEAETFNANCQECDGEGVPELCEHCFPLFDDARVMRRNAIAKAKEPCK
jgi:hypothetical protein